MLSLQCELRRRVGKCRGGETVFRVARLARAPIGTPAELSAVSVLVAVRTALELFDGETPGRRASRTPTGCPVALFAF